jgi:hypothetical protein
MWVSQKLCTRVRMRVSVHGTRVAAIAERQSMHMVVAECHYSPFARGVAYREPTAKTRGKRRKALGSNRASDLLAPSTLAALHHGGMVSRCSERGDEQLPIH